jgi:hypothetical protein
MTTRTPPTADDLAGRSQRGKDAYNERRRILARMGISTPDLYDDDALDDESDPSGAIRYWRDEANKTARIDAENRVFEEQYVADQAAARAMSGRRSN